MVTREAGATVRGSVGGIVLPGTATYTHHSRCVVTCGLVVKDPAIPLVATQVESLPLLPWTDQPLAERGLEVYPCLSRVRGEG